MTTDDLKARVRVLEHCLWKLADDFKYATDCPIEKLRLLDEGDSVHDQMVKVRLTSPRRDLKRLVERLEGNLQLLLIEFEVETGFRASEVLVHRNNVEVRLDPLPFPQRQPARYQAWRSEADSSELKVN